GAREIGFMYGQYKRLRNDFTGVLTGKGLTWGGSLARTEATGYGLCYFMDEALKAKGKSFKGAIVVVSGSGNVAIYATEKVHQLGGKVVALSDSNGYIYDAEGIKLDTVKRIKEVERKRISEYTKYHPNAKYVEGCSGIWTVKCDIALPSATQNEIDKKSAETLVANGCYAVGEGANMPSTPEAIEVFLKNKIVFGPAKAANAGGVATSALEMCQNSMRYSWTFDEVDAKLKDIMTNIYKNASAAAKEYGYEDNLVVGANIAGFIKVANAMYAQGVAY
ncbi:MAG: NADP-specific glutamate dehydrogenase, partial [Bacillota bacterium]|nr:NADP-specific glutamate dehydrogenase [Bacillota bacterium]